MRKRWLWKGITSPTKYIYMHVYKRPLRQPATRPPARQPTPNQPTSPCRSCVLMFIEAIKIKSTTANATHISWFFFGIPARSQPSMAQTACVNFRLLFAICLDNNNNGENTEQDQQASPGGKEELLILYVCRHFCLLSPLATRLSSFVFDVGFRF